MKKQVSLFILFSIAYAFGQDAPNTQKSGKAPKVISICYEAFSLPLALAAQHQRENLSDQDLYNKVVSLLETKEVIQEAFLILRSRSGETATVESVTEYLSPVEFEPADMPTHVDVSFLASETPSQEQSPTTEDPIQAKPIRTEAQKFEINGLQTSVSPTAFEHRNLGITLEIQPTIHRDGQLIELRIAPDHVELIGRISWGQQNAEAQMPEFESQRMNSRKTVIPDQPSFLGTMSRSPNSKTDPDSAQTTWYAFVTPRIISVHP